MSLNAPRNLFSVDINDSLRSFDWSTTPLGPIENWPNNLQTVLGIVSETSIQLSEHERYFREMADNAPLIIWATDAQGNNEFVNKSFLNFLGVAPEQIKGHKWESLVHPDDYGSYILRFLHACSSGQNFSADVRVRRSDGQWRWLHSLAVPRSGEAGQILGMTGCSVDITERKLAEDQLSAREAFISTIANTVPVVILLYDLSSGRALYANRSHETLYGLTVDEICRMSSEEHFARIHPEDLRRVLRFIKRCRHAKDGEITSIEYRYSNKADVYVWWKSIVSPFVRSKEGLVNQVLCVAINIDEHKRIEQEVRHYSKELLRSNRDLEQFAYIASHDLQAPLYTASAYMDLVRKRYNDKFDEKGQEFIGSVVESVHKMQQLVSDLLSYSKMGSKTRRQEIDMEQVLNQVLKNLSMTIQECGAVVRHDSVLPCINADWTKMVQLFQNIINNAIKFRCPQRSPEIVISVQEDENSWIFLIKDNGLGIAPENHRRIFDIFKRLHTEEEYPGSGIGLAVCKRIVENYDGKIWVESEYGKGTVFFISLPKEQNKSNSGT
jgi:PAS domain S-box-containing protein